MSVITAGAEDLGNHRVTSDIDLALGPDMSVRKSIVRTNPVKNTPSVLHGAKLAQVTNAALLWSTPRS